jgi:predicted nucleic acid-binding protein
MCLIVDVNIALKVLFNDGAPEFLQIRTSLENGKLRLVHGGKLTQEYAMVDRLRKLFAELDRAGKSKIVGRRRIEEVILKLKNDGNCRSDDQHILALATVAAVRLLCTGDKALEQDFKDKTIMSPAGNVFKNGSHHHLIRKHCVNVA